MIKKAYHRNVKMTTIFFIVQINVKSDEKSVELCENRLLRLSTTA